MAAFDKLKPLWPLLLALAVPISAAGQSRWQDQPDAVPWSLYAQPQLQLAVEGARRLNVICLGHGSPTVVMEAGAVNDASTWRRVQAKIGLFTRVCSYDRAGYGFSDPSPRVPTPQTLADDLHRLIGRAEFSQPVVVVAHSAGGLYATLLTDRHPDEVAGLVLLDPAFADQEQERYKLETPEELAKDMAGQLAGVALWQECARKIRAGGDPQALAECVNKVGPEASADLKPGLIARFNRPQTYDAWAAEVTALEAFMKTPGSSAPSAGNRPWGAKPVIVLTAGANTVDIFSAETNAKHRAMLKKGHEALAARSTRGRRIDVPGAGHGIQFDAPDAVVAAVNQVVEAVRKAP